MNRQYKIVPPKYFPDDIVIFKNKHGNHREGKIKWVETHYHSTTEYSHIYWIGKVDDAINYNRYEENDILKLKP